MTYKEFLKKNNFILLFDGCNDLEDFCNFVFTNDRKIFTCDELNIILSFCNDNDFSFDIFISYGKLVCHVTNSFNDDI